MSATHTATNGILKIGESNIGKQNKSPQPPRLRSHFRRGALRAPAFPTKVSLVLERTNAVRPYGFEETADCLYRLCSSHTPRAVPLSPGEGEFSVAALTRRGRRPRRPVFVGK